jgi:uncharacterized membrane protein YidH (DUF202 family)
MSDRERGEAQRRTLLATERTWLAWLRTGLTVFAVALGIGRIAPELTGGRAWPYIMLGVGYAILGVGVVAYGLYRGRAVDQAVRRGEWLNLDDRVLWTIGLLTLVLGLFTVAFILASA